MSFHVNTMDYSATLTLSKAYFQEAYEQTTRFGGRWQKILRVYSLFMKGIIVLLLGYIVGISYGKISFENFLEISGGYLVIIIVCLFFASFGVKKLWLRRQLSNKFAGYDMHLRMSEEGLHLKGPFQEGKYLWEGLEAVCETPRGIVIWPAKGQVIYLPKSQVGEDALQFVLSKSREVLGHE